MLFAVEPGDPTLDANERGSVFLPRRWIFILRAVGTSAVAFANFIETICTDIEMNPVRGDLDNRRNFLWDNL